LEGGSCEECRRFLSPFFLSPSGRVCWVVLGEGPGGLAGGEDRLSGARGVLGIL
jgi:hypothetical protein